MSPSIASIVPPLSSPAVLIVSLPVPVTPVSLHAGRNALFLVLLELFRRVELLAAVTALERVHRVPPRSVASSSVEAQQTHRATHMPSAARAGRDGNCEGESMQPRSRRGAASILTRPLLPGGSADLPCKSCRAPKCAETFPATFLPLPPLARIGT